MRFDWTEFLVLARDLWKSPSRSYSLEAACRTSVSRAYYAAFCQVRNYAERNFGFMRTKTGRDHKLLRKFLLDQKHDHSWQEIAELLEDLQMWRGKCDYDDEIDNLDVLVSSATETAEKIIEQCR